MSGAGRKEGGREPFLLPLHFINKSFLFQDSCVETSVALLQKEKAPFSPECVSPNFTCRKCQNN